jgi:hypothetical protein
MFDEHAARHVVAEPHTRCPGQACTDGTQLPLPSQLEVLSVDPEHTGEAHGAPDAVFAVTHVPL